MSPGFPLLVFAPIVFPRVPSEVVLGPRAVIDDETLVSTGALNVFEKSDASITIAGVSSIVTTVVSLKQPYMERVGLPVQLLVPHACRG